MSPLLSWLIVGTVIALSMMLMLAAPMVISSWSARLEDTRVVDLGDPAVDTVPPADDVDEDLVDVDVDAPIPYSLTTVGELACEVLSPGPMSDADWDAYIADTPPRQRPRWTPGDDAAVRRLLEGGGAPC